MTQPTILAHQAHDTLFSHRPEHRRLIVKYSGRFSSYNAQVKYDEEKMVFSLSSAWKEISPEIQQGLLEYLFCKVYGEKYQSTNQDLYHSFMKNLVKYAPIKHIDPYLATRFDLLNKTYFHDMMTRPNLTWGKQAFRKLGHYLYATDTILISSVFAQAEGDKHVQELLDFVLYHEMLHKKHQYDHKKERSIHHTKAFRADERLWPDREIEEKLRRFLRRQRLRRLLSSW